MSDEKDLQQLKKEAAERAKQLAKERLAAKKAAEQAEQSLEAHNDEDELALAKKKAAAAAKAKAAALAKQKAQESSGELSEEELAKKKAAAAAKAKAAALAKQKAQESNGELSEEELAKKKAAAAAKAKAAALAKQKAQESSGELSEEELAKKKAAAAAKAKAAALAKQKAQESNGELSEEELAKKKAAAAAKAKAAALAKAKTTKAADGAEEVKDEKPSPNQPYLDKYVKVIEEHLGKDVLENAYINRLSKDVPTLVAKKDTYYKVAQFLKYNEQLGFDYLSELHGTDFQTHMEVYVHLYSYKNNQSVALKVKIDRDDPVIDSLVPLWPGANWPECEAYDLLGIRFKGHPNLIRIFLGENWVGYPLRKDYEPYDMGV